MTEETVSDAGEGAGEAADTGDSNLSMLLSSATLVMVGQVFYSVSNLVERALIANSLSQAAYGQVGVGLSVLTVGTTFGLVGVEAGTSRYLSRYTDESERRGVLVTGGTVGVVGSVVVAAALYLNLDRLASLLQAENTELLGLFVLAIPLVAMLKLAVSFLRGVENTLYRTYAQHFIYPGMRIILVFVMLSAGWGIAAAGYAYIAAAAIAAAVAFGLFTRLFDVRGAFETHYRTMFTYSAPLVFSGFATTLLSKADTLMVASLRGPTEVALYDAAYPLAAGLTMFLGAFGFMYFPLVSRYDSEDRLDEVDEAFKLTTKWTYLFTFPVFLLFFVFSADVIAIVFTPDYREAGVALSVLAFSFFVVAATGRCTETLSAFGKTRTILVINASTLALNLGLNLVLIDRLGFVGAAVASAVAYIGMNLVYVVVLWRWFGISPFSAATVRTFVALPAVLLPPFLLIARWVRLSPLTLALLIVLLPILTLVVYVGTGCTEAQDRVAVDLIEDKLGRSLPLVDRFVPPRE